MVPASEIISVPTVEPGVMLNTTFIAKTPTTTVTRSTSTGAKNDLVKGGISKSSLAGMMAGIALASAIITGALVFIILRSRRRKLHNSADHGPQTAAKDAIVYPSPGHQQDSYLRAGAAYPMVKQEPVHEVFSHSRYEAGSITPVEVPENPIPQELPATNDNHKKASESNVI
jgi:hypothetical protein